MNQVRRRVIFSDFYRNRLLSVSGVAPCWSFKRIQVLGSQRIRFTFLTWSLNLFSRTINLSNYN